MRRPAEETDKLLEVEKLTSEELEMLLAELANKIRWQLGESLLNRDLYRNFRRLKLAMLHPLAPPCNSYGFDILVRALKQYEVAEGAVRETYKLLGHLERLLKEEDKCKELRK